MKQRLLNDPELSQKLAERRVLRGTYWLYSHAPLGWEWNFFRLREDGTLQFRANGIIDRECPLALAFMGRSDLANQFGYVTYATVANHFQLLPNFLLSHGFIDSWSARQEQPVTEDMLRIAWEKTARTSLQNQHLPHRHETKLDREYDRSWQSLDNLLNHRYRPWWQRRFPFLASLFGRKSPAPS